MLALCVAGCSGPDPGNQEMADSRILVSGGDMGALTQNVDITRGGFPLRGALVLVNGTPLVETQPGDYTGQLPAAVPAGGAILIEVIAGADTVRGSTTVPAVPRLAVPSSGSTVHLGTPLDFAWTDDTDPDEFRVGILYGSTGEFASYGGAVRSGAVVTSRIPSNTTTLTAVISSYGNGTFSGPADPGSKMHVRQAGLAVAIVPTP